MEANEQLRVELIKIINEANGEQAHFTADEILQYLSKMELNDLLRAYAQLTNPEPIKKSFSKIECFDQERDLWANVNCRNHIDPEKCGRETSCDVCERYVPNNPNPRLKENIGQEELVEGIIKIFNANSQKLWEADDGIVLRNSKFELVATEIIKAIASILPSSQSRENGVNVGLMNEILDNLADIRNNYEVINGQYVVRIEKLDTFLREKREAISNAEKQLNK